MLVVADEFGDTGVKFTQGSSNLMIIAAVIFQDIAVADAITDRLTRLRAELNLPPTFEFHFKNNSRSIREDFFRAIAPFDFVYTGVVIDKERLQLSGYAFGKDFYAAACRLVLESVSDLLHEATFRLDRSGSKTFRQELATYLKRHINDPNASVQLIKKVEMQDSDSSDLLQVADMVCGAIARSVRPERQNDDSLRKKIAHREYPLRF